MVPIDWNECFRTARIVRDVAASDHKALPLELMPISKFGNVSLFEICIAIYVADTDCDRAQVARLMPSAVEASESYERLEDFVLEMRSCAQTDFKRIGFFHGT